MKEIGKLILVLLLSGINPVYGQTIVTDRPDQTESSSTIPKGSLQIESGALVVVSGTYALALRQVLAPTALFRFGLTERIEIRIANQFESLKNENNSKEIKGMNDLEIGAKIQILRKENLNTEIAFLSHLILPTGAKGLTIGNFGTVNKLSISHMASKKIGIGYNIGYNYFGFAKGDLTYSMAIGFELSNKFGVYIEPYGVLMDFTEHISNFDAGVTFLLKENFQLDLSFGAGINHKMNYVSTGFSWNIRKRE